jgi:hypothetical protein
LEGCNRPKPGEAILALLLIIGWAGVMMWLVKGAN